MSEAPSAALDPHALQAVVTALDLALLPMSPKKTEKALRRARAQLAQIEARRQPPGGNVVRIREPSQSYTYALRLAAAAVEKLLS